MLLEEHTSCERSECKAYPKGKHLIIIRKDSSPPHVKNALGHGAALWAGASLRMTWIFLDSLYIAFMFHLTG